MSVKADRWGILDRSRHIDTISSKYHILGDERSSYRINYFREGQAPAIHHNWNSNVADIVQEQYELGQRVFLSGLWIQKWTKEQNNFQKTQKSRKRSITIITSIISKVQKIIREMWYGRNEELHNNKQSWANQSKSNEYDSMIVNIMRWKRSIPSSLLAPGERHYFRRNLQTIQKMRNKRRKDG